MVIQLIKYALVACSLRGRPCLRRVPQYVSYVVAQVLLQKETVNQKGRHHARVRRASIK